MCFKKPDTAKINWGAAREGNDYSDDLKKLVEELLVKGKDWTKDGCKEILKTITALVVKNDAAVLLKRVKSKVKSDLNKEEL